MREDNNHLNKVSENCQILKIFFRNTLDCSPKGFQQKTANAKHFNTMH